MKTKVIFKEFLLYPLLFGVVGGFLMVLAFCPKCWEGDYVLLFKNFIHQGTFWGVFTLGSQTSIFIANKYISWLKVPLKRFVLGLCLMIVFTTVGFILALMLLQVFVWGNPLNKVLSGLDIWDFSGPIIVTFGVNAFMHGREFLLSWRQNSIDLEKLKTEQIATQYDSLKNQVNPHFLFNSLNALTSLVYDDQEKAVEFIRKLSKVYRYVLESKDKEVVEMSEEIGFLESYMYLQKIRFDENLQFDMQMTEELKKCFIVPISLQMLLENAIKHNIISQAKPLYISVYQEGNYLVVKNNLQEKMHKDSTGIGINNIKARYSYMSEREVILEKTESEFIVKLPLIKSLN